MGLSMAIDAFAGARPLFLPQQFFVGQLEGWAVLESLVGGLLKRATITGHGVLDADTDTVVFIETYSFDDGHSDTLHWTIRRGQEGKYTGLENRLEGEAIGEQAGCAFHWKYTRDTPQAGGKSFKLNFDDWFYAIDDGACIVRGSAGRAVSRSRRHTSLIGSFSPATQSVDKAQVGWLVSKGNENACLFNPAKTRQFTVNVSEINLLG